MSKVIQSIRGMHDILPSQSESWQLLEMHLEQLMDLYGYREIRLPHVEKTELFARSIGDVTDIVEKEMYTFEDRNGDSLSLRPEGTASCVRAGIQHGFLHNQVQRLWYTGSMFRHERPQKGRYREFHQFGVEAFGMPGAEIDVELIAMTARLWTELNLDDVWLEINSLGTLEERAEYREKLVNYLTQYNDQLDEDSQRRLHSNPLRILDSKNPELATIIDGAPLLLDSLGPESKQYFERLKSLLGVLDIDYRVNPRLVRGLDYYSHTVFEWKTASLGAQGTICAGGRYDGLVAQLGGRVTSAVGFAMGLERILSLLESKPEWQPQQNPDIYFVVLGQDAILQGFKLVESIRSALPVLSVIFDCTAASMKSQMKKADASGATYALILGENEVLDQTITVKSLREEQAQVNIAQASIIEHVEKVFNIE